MGEICMVVGWKLGSGFGVQGSGFGVRGSGFGWRLRRNYKGGRCPKAVFSLLPLEGGGAQRRRLASLSFAFGQPHALRASPFHGKGIDGLLIPLLPPSSGRRWRVAPEVGFALFRLRPTPCPSGIPLPWEGGRFLTASPAFLRKEEINYLNSLQRSSKTSWLGFST